RRVAALLRRRAAGVQGAQAHRAQRDAAEERARQAGPQGAGQAMERKKPGTVGWVNSRVAALMVGNGAIANLPTVQRSERAPLPPLRRNFQRPVRDGECTQPAMRERALAMSFFEKKSSGFTRSTG